MSYRKLIEKFQTRTPLEEYDAVHHVLPRCKGGTNDKSNLVKVTDLEHFEAHKLLMLESPLDVQLMNSCWLTLQKVVDKVDIECYTYIKKVRTTLLNESVQVHKGNRHQLVHNALVDDYIADGWTRGKSEAVKQKLSEAGGHKHTEEAKKKISKTVADYRTGKKHTEDTKSKIAEAMKRYHAKRKSGVPPH